MSVILYVYIANATHVKSFLFKQIILPERTCLQE